MTPLTSVNSVTKPFKIRLCVIFKAIRGQKNGGRIDRVANDLVSLSKLVLWS